MDIPFYIRINMNKVYVQKWHFTKTIWSKKMHCIWRGAKYMTPKDAALACGLFWPKGNQDPTDSRITFTFALTSKIIQGGSLAQKETYYQRQLFIWIPYPDDGQHLITKHLLLPIVPWVIILPVEVLGPFPVP